MTQEVVNKTNVDTQEVVVNETNIDIQKDFYTSFFPHGHFYSPLPTWEQIKLRYKRLNLSFNSCAAIDFNIKTQLKNLDFINKNLDKYVFPQTKTSRYNYCYENGFFEKNDSTVLMSMILKFKPKRIIEIGSGWSSALMMDVNHLYFNDKIEIQCIEPYAQRLKDALGKNIDKIKLHETDAQEIPLSLFESLNKNDLLFVDSSHISKVNSDVNYIFFEILPRLKKGVLIHFHDIFFPFEYPMNWLEEGRFWNELYIMRAFLQYNNHFKIEFSNDYMQRYIKLNQLKSEFKSGGASFYLKKY